MWQKCFNFNPGWRRVKTGVVCCICIAPHLLAVWNKSPPTPTLFLFWSHSKQMFVHDPRLPVFLPRLHITLQMCVFRALLLLHWQNQVVQTVLAVICCSSQQFQRSGCLLTKTRSVHQRRSVHVCCQFAEYEALLEQWLLTSSACLEVGHFVKFAGVLWSDSISMMPFARPLEQHCSPCLACAIETSLLLESNGMLFAGSLLWDLCWHSQRRIVSCSTTGTGSLRCCVLGVDLSVQLWVLG